jgi:sugar lactone lactonase YvrE
MALSLTRMPAESIGRKCADLNGQERKTIVRQGITYTPKQICLDRKNRKLYWSDREGMRVMRADLDGGNAETLVARSRPRAN